MKIAIVGAGASGIFCATNLDERFDVTIFEAQSAPLKKLLLTGGGRCNFTNLNIDTLPPKDFYPRGAGNLRKPLKRFSAKSVIDFFENRGVKTKVEDEGRVFPVSDKSTTIANALLKNVRQKIVCNSPIVSIKKNGDKFELQPANESPKNFDVVIFAVGGRWFETLKNQLQELEHCFLPEIPSLYALSLDCANSDDWKSGTTIPCATISADFDGKKVSVSGALLLTHFGITGPATLKFSAFSAEELYAKNYNSKININFVSIREEKVAELFRIARQKEPKKLIKNFCPFELPLAFWQSVVEKSEVADITTYANLSKTAEAKITKLLTNFECLVIGKSPSKSEFVTCGGVDCKDVDFSSMQSRKVPNLFFLGECLNIDAITGGYNLHSAWTTAHICSEYLNKTYSLNS